MYNDWEAIDHIPVMACVISPFAHHDTVPAEHLEAWALAWVDVLEYREAASDADVPLCRALKWMLVLHDVLLRLPGVEGGRDVVSQRFQAWQDGDKAKLVRWWEWDRQAAHNPLR